MSFGLQTFSPSGKPHLDTSKGSMLLVDRKHLIAKLPPNASGYYYTATYPALIGQEIFHQLVPVGWGGAGGYQLGFRYPSVAITNSGGIPGISVTPTYGIDNWDYSDYMLYVYARPVGAASAGFGLHIVSSLDNAQVIADTTKILRFRGSVLPIGSTLLSLNQVRQHEYNLNSLGVTVATNNTPFLFVGIGPGQFAGIGNLFWGSGMADPNAYTVTVLSTTNYTPRLYVFTDDFLSQPHVNDFGMAVYGAAGNTIYHSGIDSKPMQTNGFAQVIYPTYPNAAEFAPVLPLNAAVALQTTVSPAPGDTVSVALAGRAASGNLRIQWVPGYYGWDLYPTNMLNGKITIINTDLYATV